MESSRISTKNHKKYSFMTFDQTMSPIPGHGPLDYSPSLMTEDLSNLIMSKGGPSEHHSHPTSMANDTEARNQSFTTHVTRPRNAFMIYRSECLAQNKISRDVEHDSRHISRIIGHCWQKLSKEEKAIWKQKADAEKAEHKHKYPDYKFSPVQRSKKPLKRNGKRNGEKDMERCRQVADLLLAGKEGQALATAIKQIDLGNADDQAIPVPIQTNHNVPAFLNPLRRSALSSTEMHSATSSISYEQRQRSAQHYYPSPPISPTSSNFMLRENSTQHPYRMAPTYPPFHDQVAQIQTGNNPLTTGPYHVNGSFSPSTSLAAFHHNEPRSTYVANNDTFLDYRGYYNF